MCRELALVEPNAGDPPGDEARVLTCGQGTIVLTAPGEKVLARLAPATAKIIVQRLPRRLGQLEANGTTRLPLPHIRAVNGVPIGGHVIDAECDKIAAAKLSVDRQIEQSQIARALLELQSRADRPDATRPQWRLRPGDLAGRQKNRRRHI
jgi:hypothetical protein